MGLQDIVNEIRKDSSAENDNVLGQAKAEAERIRTGKQAELASHYQKQRDAMEVEFKRLRQKLMAKAELDAQREVQQRESMMIEKILTGIQKALVDTLRNDKTRYLKFLSRAVKDSLPLFEGGKAGIAFAAGDEGLFEEVKKQSGAELTKLPATRITAGAILVSGNTWIDHSLDSIFEKMRPDFVRVIIEEKGK